MKDNFNLKFINLQQKATKFIGNAYVSKEDNNCPQPKLEFLLKERICNRWANSFPYKWTRYSCTPDREIHGFSLG